MKRIDAGKYAKLQKASYAGQEAEFVFPKRKGVVEVPLGFQPLGISILGTTIAIAAYFEPAVMLAEVSISAGRVKLGDIRWIRGTLCQGMNVRMFPDLFVPGGANRMQTVLIYTPTKLCLVRNADRRIFSIEQREYSGAWVNYHSFPPSTEKGLDMVHSAAITDKGLVTIESDLTGEKWAVCDYRGARVKKKQVPPYRYGIAVRTNGTVVTVSDYRAKEHGLYFDDELRVSKLTGNGVALINDGASGAFVTRYGQGHPGPFNGVPGALLYVPPQYLR